MSRERSEMVDVRRAAAETGRSAETVRRWIWSGRLSARKEGRRLLIAASDLDAFKSDRSHRPAALADWIAEVQAMRRKQTIRGSGSAANLVLQDRRRRGSSVGNGRG